MKTIKLTFSVPISVGVSLRGRPQVGQHGAPREGRPYNFLKLGYYQLIVLFLSMLAGISVPASARQEAKSTNSRAARAVVVSLYNQHEKRSPFFQRKSRALLDKYFTRELANLLWQDAHSSGDEVGALDGDPHSTPRTEITNFRYMPERSTQGAQVPVSFRIWVRTKILQVSSRESWLENCKHRV